MSIKKIDEVPKFCYDPDHDVPMFMVLPAGVYEYTCPTCGRVTRFTVNNPGLMG